MTTSVSIVFVQDANPLVRNEAFSAVGEARRPPISVSGGDPEHLIGADDRDFLCLR